MISPILKSASVLGIGLLMLGSLEAAKDPVKEMEATQAAYFKEHGTYLQVIPKEPGEMRVNVYGGPQGQGYQIIWENSEGIYAKGFGPEAQEWTRTSVKTASSTPE